MYSTCIFCHAGLGANESVEHFPVGRRLVFDAARGRLWVVCRKCERWNLTPLEERWEAIEECERLFHGTRLRASTENMGLARLRDGLELVRVGEPIRREMAAWRYGDQFGRRRKRHLAYSGVGVVVVAGFIIAGPATGFIAGGGWGLWNLVSTANSYYQARRVRARIELPEEQELVAIRLKQLKRVRLTRANQDWALEVPLRPPAPEPLSMRVARMTQPGVRYVSDEPTTLLTGDAALQAASKLLPAINAKGATRDEVNLAVEMIGDVPEPSALFSRYAGIDIRPSPLFPDGASSHYLVDLPKEARLALEMATHENAERRALEGELGLLHDEWQRAEEIAAIADDLFVGDETRAKLSALKRL